MVNLSNSSSLFSQKILVLTDMKVTLNMNHVKIKTIQDEGDHVSYSVPRPIHQPMHRSIYRSLLDQPSTDTRLTCRSTVNRESTNVSVELPLMSAEVSTVTISGAYWSTTGGISVNYRRNVGHVSFDSWARVYRHYLPIYRPILSVILDTIHRYIARYLILSTDV